MSSSNQLVQKLDWQSLLDRDGDELEDSSNLPAPSVLAAEIVEELEAAPRSVRRVRRQPAGGRH